MTDATPHHHDTDHDADTCPVCFPDGTTTMTDLDRIKAAIKRELHADGCTQADLARHLGLSQKHVSQVLSGHVPGSPRVIEDMAHACGLTIGVAP